MNQTSNEKLNTDEFWQKKLVLESHPQKLFVEISRNCNLKCRMCKNRKEKYSAKRNMNKELFRKIADELFSHARYVDLRGFGESLIHPGFEEFIDYAPKHKCDFGLVTNLMAKNDMLIRKLIKKDFWLGISIDGATKETFEKIRKGSSFELLLHNLDIIKEEREKNKTNPWRTYFIVTLQKDNIEELPEIIALAEQKGIIRVEINPVQLPFFDIRRISFHKKKLAESMRKAEEKAKRTDITILYDGRVLGGRKEQKKSPDIIRRCRNPWTSLYIAYDGKIGPCNHLMSKPLVLGDLTKRSFQEEWNNKKFQKFRKYNDTKLRYRACNWCYKNRYDHF